MFGVVHLPPLSLNVILLMSDLLFNLLLSIAVLIMVVFIPIVFIINKEELTQGLNNRLDEEINQALPYANAYEANREFVSSSIRPMVWYGLYFIVSVSVLIHVFGRIEFADNTPYTVSLIVLGIPWLICFAHAFNNLNTHRTRMLASRLPEESVSFFHAYWPVLVPFIYLYLIVTIVKISNHLLS